VRGLDTNLLVRYVVQDDLRQAAIAEREIDGAADRGETMLIQPVVLCELEWVLDSCYKYPRPQIVAALERILQTAQFECADKDTVSQALGDYWRGPGDFSDYYLGRANAAAGADATLTFDKGLRSDPRFTFLSA
jgi:predicted nucleic-acid-binding protein